MGEKTETADLGSDPGSENPGDAFHFKPGHSVGYLLRTCYRAFAKALEVPINQHDVGIGQWYFLRELWEEDGLTQRELASRVGIAAPTTAVAVRGMVKDGLIKQVPDPADRRKKRIFLTARARRLQNILLPHARDVNRQATKGFTKKEIRQLRDYINRMKQNLERD
jgi:MarR family transcriptional regulator, organic hydroperoxide resistance regulator